MYKGGTRRYIDDGDPILIIRGFLISNTEILLMIQISSTLILPITVSGMHLLLWNNLLGDNS